MTILKTLLGLVIALALPVIGQEIPKVLAIGSDLPDFSLPGTDGKTYTPADFKDAELLCVIFTSNHCPDAVAAAVRTEQIHQDYRDKGVALVAVNGNNADSLTPDELGYSPFSDSFDEMTPFAKDYGWTFPYLYDGDKQEFVSACGGQSTPHVFLFDADRKLRYTGRMDDNPRTPGAETTHELRDAVDALLAGKKPEVEVTNPIGCNVKWAGKDRHWMPPDACDLV
jgi:thiol-disulfide isomerase/thioredoxin